MKWLTSTLAATVLAASLASPAFAEHRDNRYDRGLSKREAVNQVMRTFDRIDRNKNGKISRREVAAYNRHDHHAGGYHRSNWDPYRFDDKKNLITPANFNRYDRNKDGVLKRNEIRRAVQTRFERADRNNDGYLSDREIRRAGWFDFDDDYDWNKGRDQRWDYERDRHHHH